ncbi:MAG: valine--tRNA ligase [Pseudomonadota bacterium]
MPMEKTFDARAAEPQITQAWDDINAFAAGANASRDESFCVMIPPPNVNGRLHIGHAFNNTLQDILVRWKRMQGFDTLWQPGQDHAGIALQIAVQKELAAQNINIKDLSREEFLGLAWEYKEFTADGIVNQLKKLGASCDWSRNAFTMSGAPGDTRKGHENSPNFHDAVLRTFVDLYNDGKIYRGKRLVNWDPKMETAISDLEVENVEVAGHMWHFKYPLAGGATYTYIEKDEDGKVTLEEERDYISIATTRPETMLGDGAVAVHPDDPRYAPIVGKLCEIPVGPKEHRRLIPIITDEYPDPDFGSGAVKITGAHDFNDYAVAKRGGIPMYRLMDTKGHMRDDGVAYADAAAAAQGIAEGAEFTTYSVDQLNLVPDHLRGLDRFEARKKVVEEITAEGLAVTTRADNPVLGKAALKPGAEGADTAVALIESKPIMQPFGDRSKVVIEPMLTDQWFVDAEKLAQPALEAVRDGRTKILPERDEKVYFHWLENIEPWCISRQLWWGHQVPVWYGPRVEDGQLIMEAPWKEFCAANVSDMTTQAVQYYGGTVMIFDEEPQLKRVGGPMGIQGTVPVWRDPDVLDTWFSSGLWPLGTLGWPEENDALARYFPTDVLVTGFDIIFFWVARMMMMQLEVADKVPFHTVYVHALVRDEKGKKMSKSLGNVLDPLELIDEYGADAVRFTLTAMAAMGRDLKLSTSRIQGYRNFGTKLWNAARFAEMNDCKPDAEYDPSSCEATVNKWIVGETAKAREAVDAALDAYRFNDAANTLYAFVWGTVCDWYVEFTKPLLQSDGAQKAETQATMAWVIDQCLLMLHPIMPYITEELWAAITDRPKMLVHGDWPTYGAELVDPAAEREMNWVVNLIEQIRSVRAEMRVNAGAKTDLVLLGLDATAATALERNQAMVERLARINSISSADEAPKGAVTLAVEGGSVCLPLADLIDVDAEKARLAKALGKLEGELSGLQKKLSNEKFIANAPQEVVDENRARVDALGDEIQTLLAAQTRVAALG